MSVFCGVSVFNLVWLYIVKNFLLLQAFEDANLCQTLNKNIAKAGYSKLTPVQKYSIPVILAGRDLMACAHTGSGKTVSILCSVHATGSVRPRTSG